MCVCVCECDDGLSSNFSKERTFEVDPSVAMAWSTENLIAVGSTTGGIRIMDSSTFNVRAASSYHPLSFECQLRRAPTVTFSPESTKGCQLRTPPIRDGKLSIHAPDLYLPLSFWITDPGEGLPQPVSRHADPIPGLAL